MKVLDLELDEVESAQLIRFARLNNVSIEEAAGLLIKQRLDEWADSIFDEKTSDDAKH